jgi:hypothetical protein
METNNITDVNTSVEKLDLDIDSWLGAPGADSVITPTETEDSKPNIFDSLKTDISFLDADNKSETEGKVNEEVMQNINNMLDQDLKSNEEEEEVITKGRPKAEKSATLTKGDDGFDSVDASDADNDKEATQNIGSDSTAKKLGNLATGKEETFNRILGLVEKYKDDKDKVDAFINKAKNEYKLSKTLLDQLKRVAGRDVKI